MGKSVETHISIERENFLGVLSKDRK